ncbi:MAG: 1-deoxy-D-xylulose-5-phosphate synthase [Thermoanaerobaculia bacterium]
MSLLDQVHSPRDLRKLKASELPKLAQELREEVLQVVAKTGGYLASNLGVIELTVALHYAFDTPNDRLVWDVGHQTYAHKILTGRRDRMATMRSYGGLSGFLSRQESEYDVSEAGHASTSISEALGLAIARDLKGEKHHVVAVIGDGAVTAGMAFEAMNQAGHLGKRLIVVLNDNSMAITPSVGAMTRYLKEIMAGRHYAKLKDDIRRVIQKLPGVGEQMLEVVKGIEEGLRQTFTPGSLFEELGFRFLGPINGHAFPALLAALKEAQGIDGPVLLHVVTQAGKGYRPAEDSPAEFRGTTPAEGPRGEPQEPPTYTEIFGRTALRLAERDSRIVAITAAMPEGTGLAAFAEKLPKRFLNTGIAEQHTVALAAGLALDGLRPLVAVYSSFLQRGFDQIFHDVCLMDLPVVFALDRSGLVDADGASQHGLLDFTYLRALPNMVVAAPMDENELAAMLTTAFELTHPVAIRYPAGPGFGVKLDRDLHTLPPGKAEVLRRGKDGLVWAAGVTVRPALAAAERLAQGGLELTVVNARFIKPLDRDLLASQLASGGKVATVEEHGLAGGFGGAVLEAVSEMGLEGVETLCLGIPDRVVPHGSQRVLRRALGLDAEGIYFRLRQFFASGALPASGRRA